MGACKAAASYGTVDPAVVQQRHLFARSVREGALEQALRFAEAALLVEVQALVCESQRGGCAVGGAGAAGAIGAAGAAGAVGGAAGASGVAEGSVA